MTSATISSTLPPALTHWPGYLLTFIAEHASDRFERAVAAHGIRSRHASVLVVIDAEGPMSQRALGRRLRIDKSPMVGVLDDLERLRLAERRRSDSDRRIQAVHLTAKGRRVLAACEKAVADFEATMMKGFSKSDRATLLNVVKSAVQNLGGGFGDGAGAASPARPARPSARRRP